MLGAGTFLLVQIPRHILVDLPGDLDALLTRHRFAHLLGDLLLDVDGVLGADCARKLPTFLPRNIDRDIRTFLLWNIFTLRPRHLFLYFLWDLFTFLFGNLRSIVGINTLTIFHLLSPSRRTDDIHSHGTVARIQWSTFAHTAGQSQSRTPCRTASCRLPCISPHSETAF